MEKLIHGWKASGELGSYRHYNFFPSQLWKQQLNFEILTFVNSMYECTDRVITGQHVRLILRKVDALNRDWATKRAQELVSWRRLQKVGCCYIVSFPPNFGKQQLILVPRTENCIHSRYHRTLLVLIASQLLLTKRLHLHPWCSESDPSTPSIRQHLTFLILLL